VTLDQARDHVGHGVVYRAPHVGYGDPGPEQGEITSVGQQYVFVRYAGDQHSKATVPEALTLLAGVA
jgi:hypothetical protein